jgi:hypothetical protein
MTGAITSNSNITLTGSGKYIGDGSSLSNVGVDGIVSTANATAITIDSNEKVAMTGDLQIGTDNVAGNNTAQALHHELRVIGGTDGGVLSIANGYKAYQTGSGDPLGGLYFTDVTGGSWAAIKAKGDGQGGGSVGSPLNSNDYPGRLEFYTTPDGSGTLTERLRITSAGNVGIGTASPDQALDVAGEIRTSNGILFGTDTASANRMDDYEEGIWTPGFMLGSPTYTTTYSRGGVYCKIGNMVHVLAEIYMGAISFGDGSQLMRIGPLPYATNPSIGTSFGLAHASCIRVHNWYTEGSTYNNAGIGYATMLGMYPKIITGTNYIEVHISVGNNHGGSAFKNAAFHNGSAMSLGITYRSA